MVDRLKDSVDLKLEALFGSSRLADDGFSARVIVRVRRQIWIRRLAMPVAFAVGMAIAFKPVSQLLKSVSGLLSFIPQIIADNNVVSLPNVETIQFPIVWMAGMLIAGAVLANQLLQD